MSFFGQFAPGGAYNPLTYLGTALNPANIQQQAVQQVVSPQDAAKAAQTVPAVDPNAVPQQAPTPPPAPPVPPPVPEQQPETPPADPAAVAALRARWGAAQPSSPQAASLAPAAPSMGQDYASRVRGVESSGNDNAVNGTSVGRYQFSEGTWRGLMRKYPQLGLTEDGRTDPRQQERAMAALTDENRQALQSATGQAPDDATLYSAHFLGSPAAVGVAKAAPDADLRSTIEAAVGRSNAAKFFAANPSILKNGMTVADFRSWAQRKMGGGTSATPVGPASAPAGSPQPAPQAPPGPQGYDPAQGGQDAFLSQPQAPQQAPVDDSIMGRLSRPGVADGFLALGSGLLSGRNMADGIGKAAQGFQGALKVSRDEDFRQQEMGLKREDMGLRRDDLSLRRDEAKARLGYQNASLDLKRQQIAQAQAATRNQSAGTFYGPDGTVFQAVFSPGTATGYQYRNAVTGELAATLPQGAVRAEDSAMRSYNQQDGKDAQAFITSASQAPANISRINGLRSVLATSGAGGSVMDMLTRGLVQASGRDVGSVNAADMDTAKAYLSQLELGASELMKGQGQITESERKILRDSVGSIRSNPVALQRILSVMEQAEQRKMALADSWISASPEEKRQGFSTYRYAWSRQNVKDAAPQQQSAAKAPPEVGFVKDGYRFKGGDPAQSSSWEKVQ